MNQVEKVKEMCKEKKISIHKLEMDCGFANGYISQLKKGVFPSDRLQKIADYFGVSVNYFIELQKVTTVEEPEIIKVEIPIGNTFTAEEKEFLNLFETASPEAREFVISTLKRSIQVSSPRE